MIPRSQHFGDRAPFPVNWSGIMRVFEEAAFEAFLLTARRGAHYAGKQPNASIEKGERRHLAAGEDIVAYRYREDRALLEQALVHALETAAQDRDAGAGGEVAGEGLGERLATRGHREKRRARVLGGRGVGGG